MKILFVYHADRGLHKEVTQSHFQQILKNDGDIVIPIADHVDYLPNTWVGDRYPQPIPRGNPWSMSDSLIYNWALQNKLEDDVYAIIEWDTLCTTSLHAQFKEFLDKPLTGYRVTNNRKWNWITDKDHPEPWGIIPFSCVFVQKNVLLKISETVAENPYWHTFDNNEARFATVAHDLGVELSSYEHLFKTIQAREVTVSSTPGIYHSVKIL